MNLSQLEYLEATVRLGSFTAAARSLYVTPQTISKSLGELEEELGISLFEKRGRRIVVTDAAALIAEKAENVSEAVKDLRRVAAQIQRPVECPARHLSVAVASAPLRGQMVPDALFDDFCSSHPDIVLNRIDKSSESCLVAVQQGIVDAAVTLGRTTRPGLVWTQLYPFEFCVTVGAGHPLAGRSGLSVFDLRDIPIATPMDFRCSYRIVANHFKAQGIAVRYTEIPATVEGHQEFLDAGGALLTSPTPQLESQYRDIVTLRFRRDDAVGLPVCLIHREDNDNPALRALQLSLLRKARSL